MAKETSIVKVYDSQRGRWAASVRVQLGWDGIINLGMSEQVRTDESGMAVVQHSATGEANVYIDGKKIGKMHTPGSATFQI